MDKTKCCYICIIVLMFFLSSCQPDIQAISFESYPDGTPVILDKVDDSGGPFHPIRGDIYADWGFYLMSSPIDDCLAIITYRFDSEDLFLGLNTMFECGNANRLEIEFIEPVKSVDVAFVGIATTYRMDIIDSGGEVFDSSSIMCDGKFDDTLTHLTYTSTTSNIKKISIGANIEMPLSIINVKDLNIER